jgi:hypothetical protein
VDSRAGAHREDFRGAARAHGERFVPHGDHLDEAANGDDYLEYVASDKEHGAEDSSEDAASWCRSDTSVAVAEFRLSSEQPARP